VRGIDEAMPSAGLEGGLGTHQYTAPEHFLGDAGTTRSDIYSLGVIAYQMITGRLPYGARMAQARTRAQQAKVAYASVLDDTREIPAWIDGALRKAVHPYPLERYEELSEFIHDLRHPNRDLLDYNAAPLIKHNPLLFWKGLSAVLAAAVLLLLALQFGHWH